MNRFHAFGLEKLSLAIWWWCFGAVVLPAAEHDPAVVMGEHFVLCPVTTDLQRWLLEDGTEKTSVCVFVNAAAFVEEEKLDRFLPPFEALQEKLTELPKEIDSRVVFRCITDNEAIKHHEKLTERLERISAVCEEVGYYSGFLAVKSVQIYHAADFQWDGFLEKAQTTATQAKSAVEPVGGNNRVQVFPVRTLLTRLLVDADCLVNILPVVRAHHEFPEAFVDDLKKYLPQHEYVKQKTLLLKLKYSGPVREQIEAWIDDIEGTRQFARQLGFESCKVSFGSTNQPDGLTQGPAVQLQFSLKLVDSEGEPVPGAEVEFRTKPAPAMRHVRRGTFVTGGGSSATIQADDTGKIRFTIPGRPSRFALKILHSGYGPYWAEWNTSSHPQELPKQLTSELDPAWTVGCIFVDEADDPIVLSSIHPSIKFKRPPGVSDELHMGDDFSTDDEGRWSFASVPASMDQVSIEVDHPEYMSGWISLARGSYEVAPGAEPTAKLTLRRGITVEGRVTDDQGDPVPGATVRTKVGNRRRQATTDESGNYQLTGCEEQIERIVVSAPGKALELQEVFVTPDMEPVNFTLKPGGHVRVRVVDENGKGIPRTRIFFQHWRGRIDYFEFDHIDDYTNQDGVWEWNEAPLDEFRADICRPNGMQLLEQPIQAREEEYVFRPPPLLLVTGNVVDADTGKPVEAFTVTPGRRYEQQPDQVSWLERDSHQATDGKYFVRFNRGYPALKVRIEAPGYQKAVSRELAADEGETQVDFRLKPAEEIVATILTPDGEPAADAKVVFGEAGSQISIKNGEIDNGSTYAKHLELKDAAQIRVPQGDEPFRLVIVHPSGFAHVKAEKEEISDKITLTPWARAEGTFYVGGKPAADVVLNIFGGGISSYGRNAPNIFTTTETTTDTQGTFVFERVFPGKARIGREIVLMVNEGATEATSSHRVATEFTTGETTQLELGKSGRPVTFHLLPHTDFEGEPLWQFAYIRVQADLDAPQQPEYPEDVKNDPEKRSAWYQTWKATPEGQQWLEEYQAYRQARERSPYITAVPDSHGQVTIDDVPPGDYVMSISFDRHSAGTLQDYNFTVPAAEGESFQPFNLGVIGLEGDSK